MLVLFFYNLSLLMSIIVVLSLGNWFLIWCSMELVTSLLVILMSQDISPRSVESVSKYFIAQAVASAFLLLGVALRYFLSGEVSLFSQYGGLSYLLIMMALFVKMAVIPNPYWFIDTVSGLKLVSSFYVIITSKIVPIYLYVSMTNGVFSNLLVLVGLGSVIIGSVLGMNQLNVRKIVALSSIAHLGWLIVGLPFLGFYECIVIFGLYMLTVIPLLWVAGYYQINDLSKIKQAYNSPYASLLMITSLLSLGGFPPLLGFFYKWMIFIGVMKQGAYMICSVLVIMSLVSLFFYLRLCFNLYSLYWSEVKMFKLFNLSSQSSWDKMWIPLILLSFMLLTGFLCLGPVLV